MYIYICVVYIYIYIYVCFLGGGRRKGYSKFSGGIDNRTYAGKYQQVRMYARQSVRLGAWA